MNPETERAIRLCQRLFGDDRVVIFSNSAGLSGMVESRRRLWRRPRLSPCGGDRRGDAHQGDTSQAEEARRLAGGGLHVGFGSAERGDDGGRSVSHGHLWRESAGNADGRCRYLHGGERQQGRHFREKGGKGVAEVVLVYERQTAVPSHCVEVLGVRNVECLFNKPTNTTGRR